MKKLALAITAILLLSVLFSCSSINLDGDNPGNYNLENRHESKESERLASDFFDALKSKDYAKASRCIYFGDEEYDDVFDTSSDVYLDTTLPHLSFSVINSIKYALDDGLFVGVVVYCSYIDSSDFHRNFEKEFNKAYEKNQNLDENSLMNLYDSMFNETYEAYKNKFAKTTEKYIMLNCVQNSKGEWKIDMDDEYRFVEITNVISGNAYQLSDF